MESKKYIDSLFDAYEDSEMLRDFKEELLSNLEDRIKSLKNKGFDDAAAFDKALQELGDVSALADEISLKKRKEIFQEVYMNTRNYMTRGRVIAYISFAAIFLLGIIVAILAGLTVGNIGAVGVMVLFAAVPAAGITFLVMTQETAARYPMTKKRALWYAGAAGLIAFGLVTFLLTFFATGFSNLDNFKNLNFVAAIGTLIPFILPAAIILAYLVLTEKDRSKPWFAKQREEIVKRALDRFANPASAERYGLLSGIIWILGVAFFILLTIKLGIAVSWMAMVAALIAQMLLEVVFSGKN